MSSSSGDGSEDNYEEDDDLSRDDDEDDAEDGGDDEDVEDEMEVEGAAGGGIANQETAGRDSDSDCMHAGGEERDSISLDGNESDEGVNAFVDSLADDAAQLQRRSEWQAFRASLRTDREKWIYIRDELIKNNQESYQDHNKKSFKPVPNKLNSLKLERQVTLLGCNHTIPKSFRSTLQC